MHGIVQILRLTLFEMTSLDRVLTLVVEGPTQLVDATQLIWSKNVGTVVS